MLQDVLQRKALRAFIEHRRIKELKQYLKAQGPPNAVICRDPKTLKGYVTEAEYSGAETLQEVRIDSKRRQNVRCD